MYSVAHLIREEHKDPEVGRKKGRQQLRTGFPLSFQNSEKETALQSWTGPGVSSSWAPQEQHCLSFYIQSNTKCTYENITIYTIEHRRASMGKQTLTPICRGVLKNFVSLVPYFVFMSVHCISICLTYVNFVLLSNIVTYFISC